MFAEMGVRSLHALLLLSHCMVMSLATPISPLNPTLSLDITNGSISDYDLTAK